MMLAEERRRWEGERREDTEGERKEMKNERRRGYKLRYRKAKAKLMTLLPSPAHWRR